MRIPLDYYRILGLPIQATSDQLRQAHRDRTLQLPRREYSDAAIAARKQLLDQAYTVLVNPEQRKRYDSGFLAKTYELDQGSPSVFDAEVPNPSEDSTLVDPHTPSVEIEDDQFIGALLILQELGEYELVLKLGRPFLTGGSASLQDHHYGDPAIVFSDIVLTVALACLELGREQWQQGQYENAAEALETGQQLLLREGLFVNVRGEIQSDLYRLRPYRILELLAAPENDVDDRRTGMKLLEEMLQERGGIDGGQNDQSGLGVDDFLKFIQQLRSYLTAAEQQYLFEQESSRPSAVATYLAVYALMARGFAEREPELVFQAKAYLARLSDRQDVHLEEAISALLLGQTETASQALGKSQEHESIDFIRQHSQNSPDLLPGLCLYTERWFHDEVFPHFRDLAHCRISLKEYFADRQVQNYLEALPSEAEEVVTATVPVQSTVRDSSFNPRAAAPSFAASSKHREDLELVAATRKPFENREASIDHDTLIAAARARIASRSGTATLNADGPFAGSVSTAERIDQESNQTSPSAPQSRSQWSRSRNEPLNNEDGSDAMATRKMGDRPTKIRSSRSPSWLIPAGALLGIILLGALAAWLFRTLQPSSQTAQNNEPLLIQLDKPLLTLVEETTDPTTVKVIDQASAKALIDAWLAAKAKAMGSTHDVASLDQILADPKLAEWRSASDEAKRDGWYRTYKHDVAVESVELISSATGQVVSTQSSTVGAASSTQPGTPAGATDAITAQPSSDVTATASPTATPAPLATASPDTLSSASPPVSPSPAIAPQPSSAPAGVADQAKVIANVTETTETYRDGKASGAPQTEQLRVQYNLVLKDGKWRIQDWQLL